MSHTSTQKERYVWGVPASDYFNLLVWLTLQAQLCSEVLERSTKCCIVHGVHFAKFLNRRSRHVQLRFWFGLTYEVLRTIPKWWSLESTILLPIDARDHVHEIGFFVCTRLLHSLGESIMYIFPSPFQKLHTNNNWAFCLPYEMECFS